MFQILYGSTAAGLYDQAAKLNAQARTLYLQSSDTYYKANDGMGPVLDALTFVPPRWSTKGLRDFLALRLSHYARPCFFR